MLRRRLLPVELCEAGQLEQFRSRVMACLLSLYRDRIRPTLDNFRRRLKEGKCPDVMIQALLPFCARVDALNIMPPLRGEQPTIFFLQEPDWFEGWVDVEALEPESAEAWAALVGLVQKDDNLSLPCGPYQAAIELRSRAVPGLQQCSLGELEHLVRLAIGRRLLGSHSDRLQPARFARGLPAKDKPSATASASVKASSKAKGAASAAGNVGQQLQTPSARTGDDHRASSKQEVAKEAVSRLPGSRRSDSVNGSVAPAAPPNGNTPGSKPPALEGQGKGRAAGRLGKDLDSLLLKLMGEFPDGVCLSEVKCFITGKSGAWQEQPFTSTKLPDLLGAAPLDSLFPAERIPDAKSGETAWPSLSTSQLPAPSRKRGPRNGAPPVPVSAASVPVEG